MSRRKLFLISASIIIFIFIINYLANFFYWYSSVWYFDMIMHFLGGFWVALALVWLFFPENINYKLIFGFLFGTLIVGLGWEFFEFFINANVARLPFDLVDTTSDLLFDLLGGCFALAFFSQKTNLKV